jgi:glucosamine--fructose-6-phosphate aminotransferase (isomerizing)
MCSIFSYVAKSGKTADISILAEIVAANISRGPHAMGFAWIEQSGRMRCWKQPGNPIKMIGMLKQMRKAVMLVGHLRFATHGDPGDNITNHPHACDSGWIVHNGVIQNHRQLISDYKLCPVSECDSEVIGLLAEKAEDETQMGRLISAVELCRGGGLAVGGLWTRRRQLVMIRRGNPLHISETAAGWYMASLADGLPGKRDDIKSFADGSAVRFTQRGVAVDIEQDTVKYPPTPKFYEPPKRLAAVTEASARRTYANADTFEDEWWKTKPGSKSTKAKPAAAPAAVKPEQTIELDGDDMADGGPTGVNADGSVTGEYRGG